MTFKEEAMLRSLREDLWIPETRHRMMVEGITSDEDRE